MIDKAEILKIIDELEEKHMGAMNSCAMDDMRTYYSNQAAVLVLETLKHRLKRLENGEA